MLNETLVKIATPNGVGRFRLDQGVETVDVTKGKAARFTHEEGTIDAIEVTPENAPASSGG